MWAYRIAEVSICNDDLHQRGRILTDTRCPVGLSFLRNERRVKGDSGFLVMLPKSRQES
jgi:hypothetical protein